MQRKKKKSNIGPLLSSCPVMDDPLLALANNAELIRDTLVIIFHDAERLPFITAVLRKANFLSCFFHVQRLLLHVFKAAARQILLIMYHATFADQT